MLSKELKPQILSSPDGTGRNPENPYASTLARYEQIVGRQNLLPISEAVRIIINKTKASYYLVQYKLARLNEALNLESTSIPPDVFIFNYDLQTDKTELKKRFAWTRINTTQTARVLFSIRETDITILSQKIKDGATDTYPSIKPLLQKKTEFKDELDIPARFFLKRFDKLLPEEERIVIESAVRKYKLSPTECAIFLLITQAKTNQEIAESINISPETIKNHAANIFSKLNRHGSQQIYNRTQATIVALKEDLLPRSLATTFPEIKLIPNLEILSPRESEVFWYVAQGWSNQEIALKLGISDQTVKII
jgi:DNA-binding NarL/FixJ family response regulator